MKLNSNIILKILYVLTWAGFLGLCVKVGSMIYSFCVSIFYNPIGAKNLYSGLDLSQLMERSKSEYIILVLCLIAMNILKIVLFFVLLQIFRKINLVSPFHEKIGKLIFNLSLLSLGIGILSGLASALTIDRLERGIEMPHLTNHIGQGSVFLLFGGILFFISVLFKKGIELQTESELTI